MEFSALAKAFSSSEEVCRCILKSDFLKASKDGAVFVLFCFTVVYSSGRTAVLGAWLLLCGYRVQLFGKFWETSCCGCVSLFVFVPVTGSGRMALASKKKKKKIETAGL